MALIGLPATPDTAFGLPGNEPLDLSTPLPDESKHKTVNPFASMPPASDWSSKAGIDYRKPSFPAADLQPGALTAGVRFRAAIRGIADIRSA